MLFGVENAFVTFQHVMDIMVFFAKPEFALVYQEDAVIFSQKPRQQINRV